MTHTVTGMVIATKRHGTTYYGNPIVSVCLDTDPSHWLRISDNADLVYGIGNREYRDTPHTFRLTRAGRLSGYACPAEEI